MGGLVNGAGGWGRARTFSSPLIKNLAHPRLLFLHIAVTLILMVVLTVMAFIRVGLCLLALLGRCLALRHDRRGCRRDDGRRAVEQLVEFTPIQPDAAAAWAVIDLDALSIGHDQRGLGAVGTFHVSFFQVVEEKGCNGARYFMFHGRCSRSDQRVNDSRIEQGLTLTGSMHL